MIVTYCRPGGLLRPRQEDLIRPMQDVASGWSLLLHPGQGGVPSKLQSYDDIIGFRNITKVAAVLAFCRPPERIFENRYDDFTKEFRRASRAPGMRNIVPYQCRHSGASLDKAELHRAMLEIKKMGKVEVGQQHCSIRKISKTDTDPVRSQQKSRGLFPSHRLNSRGAYLWVTPSRGRFTGLSDGGRLFLIFSNERVGRAAQRLGVRAAFWNLRYVDRVCLRTRILISGSRIPCARDLRLCLSLPLPRFSKGARRGIKHACGYTPMSEAKSKLS